MNQPENLMRRLEFVEGKSSKFWQVEQIAADLHIQWGRIGTAGQSQVKAFADESKAQAALAKLIAEKTAKGYVEVDTAPAVAAPEPATTQQPADQPTPQAAPTSAVAATQSTAETESVAPWLANGDPVQIPADLMALVMPSRAAPLPVVTVDATAAWQEMREHLATFTRFDLDRCAPSLREHVETALRRLQQDATGEACVSSDAVLLRLLMDGANHLKVRDRTLDSRFVEYLIARHGLPGALEVLLASQTWLLCHEFRADAKPGQRHLWFLREGNRQLEHIGATERVLRRHLAVAPEREWAVCAARIREILPTRPPTGQVVLALLLPEAPGLAADVAARLLKQDKAEAASYLLANLRDPALIADIVKACQWGHYFSPMSFWGDQALLLSAVHTLGSGAEQLLIPAAAEQKVYQALSCIGTPRSIATLALQLTHDDRAKTLAAHFRDALRHWPLAAIAALAGLLAGERSAVHLHSHFAALVREQLGQVPRLLPWLAPQAREVLRREAAKFDGTLPIATQDELPAVLASPPWLRPRTKKAVAPLTLEPLTLPAAERWPAGEREALLQRMHTPQPGLLDAKQLAEALNIATEQLGHAAEAIRAGDIQRLLHTWNRSHRFGQYAGYRPLYGSDVSRLPEEMAIAFWNHALEHTGYSESFRLAETDLLLAHHGLRVLPALLILLQNRPAEAIPHVSRFAAVEIAPFMACAFVRLKSQRHSARRWLLSHPEHAACALIAPAVGKRGEARNQAAAALRLIAEQGHEALILEVAARYDEAKVVAAVRAMLAEDPLDLFPARRSTLPDFWQPQDWTRPRLRACGKVLPPVALDALGQMMTFPVVGESYAGLAQVREACTRQSLAEFAWDCFVAWYNHDAPARGNWAFAMLGHLGNDDTARRLAVLIRGWPSEGRFGRSLAGLDVLATIGSDVSLMLLNGIAQKVKSKALQDRAREKIQAIAAARGMSREALEDRLVPTFGLDAKGTLLLDFGPRRFTVGFDEMLRPYVRDDSGACLANLPKPRQSDDAEKSQTATNLFKQIKKDVRTVASGQVRRLEAAMCSRRRWLPETFRQCLVEHPLLRHLVQRLVWGVYTVDGLEDDESGHGGRLLQCFRIAEDGSATSAADDPLTLPEGGAIRYGLPHALELQAEDTAAFARLFADYQLLQPFAQLDRSTYTLSDSELAGGQLERWRGVEIDTRRLLGLAQRGWHRGTPQDAACYHDYGKPLDERRVMLLRFAPGIPVDMPEEEPTQILETVSFGEPWGFSGVREEPFATLDPIAASELIRDMEHLCA